MYTLRYVDVNRIQEIPLYRGTLNRDDTVPYRALRYRTKPIPEYGTALCSIWASTLRIRVHTSTYRLPNKYLPSAGIVHFQAFIIISFEQVSESYLEFTVCY